MARETAACQAKAAARAEAVASGRRRASGTRSVPAQEYCRVREARAELERARARAAGRAEPAAAGGKGKKRQGPGQRNVADPDSRLMPVRGGGFVQGHNPQNVTSVDGLLIATRLTNTTGNVTWFEPMTAEAASAASMAARLATPDGIAGNSGGWVVENAVEDRAQHF